MESVPVSSDEQHFATCDSCPLVLDSFPSEDHLCITPFEIVLLDGLEEGDEPKREKPKEANLFFSF